ncbi:MAG: galactose mutarotase [Bacilli bacterium]|jgi:aldose 1-epimerase|nr:galactose mutarotase [Bacilli bacterium]
MGRLIRVVNQLGMEVTFASVGAAIFDIRIPDQEGILKNVMVHPASLDDFEVSDAYYGKTIGRNAGRIKDGNFTLDGVHYHVEAATKDGLHGGIDGLPYRDFAFIERHLADGEAVIFSYFSPDMECGFPGNLSLKVTYKLFAKENRLDVTYSANSDQKTIANFTNHSYWNLNGGGTILNHNLTIRSSLAGKVDKKIYPLGIFPVDEQMDFRMGKVIGKDIAEKDLVAISGGYDHPFVIDNPEDSSQPVASLKGDFMQMDIYSDYPALVFYSGNYPSREKMNVAAVLGRYEALALECQIFPDAMNEPFGQKETGILEADEEFHHQISYRFKLI